MVCNHNQPVPKTWAKAPLLPAADSGSGVLEISLPEFTATKSLSKEVERIRVEIGGGAPFMAKVVKDKKGKQHAKGGDAEETMNLHDLLQPKKKARAAPKRPAVSHTQLESIETMEAEVEQNSGTGAGSTHRKRWWVDDLLACLIHAAGDIDTLLDPANRDALRLALSSGLQLAFRKSVILNGKPKKVWSQVRPLLQDMIRKSVAKLNASLVGFDNSEIAANITKMAEQEKQRARSAASRDLEGWLVESAVDCVRGWVKRNPSASHLDHSTFAVVWRTVCARICSCASATEPSKTCPAHAMCSLSLADIIWWMSEIIFEHIPFAVPTVPMALTCRVQQHTPSDRAPHVPPSCAFLCNDATQTAP
ncbi:unnamed protein product [Effrenium voratum]|nr:unnamed protein product [Effrenium voratum]